MVRPGLRFILILFAVIIFITCIDPYTPRFSASDAVMVVEGLLTNDNRSYQVRLSYTRQAKDSAANTISDASVQISDDAGNTANLAFAGNGIYKTDSLTFRGEVGKKYVLHIHMTNGNEYASDTCEMLDVPDIDSVYYGRDLRYTKNQTNLMLGISIYVDTREALNESTFLRWDFDETWKFRVPFPSTYEYINDSTIPQISPDKVNDVCYRSASSTSIIIGEVNGSISDRLQKQFVTFITPSESNKLSVRYSILLHQYSISYNEYKFWNDLKKMDESVGDIFGSQPFAVSGNIKNIADPNEHVLGYFQVSAVKHKRIFINYDQLIPIGIKNYTCPCKALAKSPRDYAMGWGTPPTWDEIFEMFTINPGGYELVEPQFGSNGLLSKLVFTKAECADCRVEGVRKKPDFWVDN